MATEYCQIVKDRISMLLQQIGQAAKLDSDVLLVQEILSNAYVWIDEDVNVNWPVKDIGEVKEVLKEFAKRGILLDLFIKSEISPRWRLKHEEVFIYLSPSWGKEEGASCRLVQVGTKTYESPIYKLICTDKEADEILSKGVENKLEEEIPF